MKKTFKGIVDLVKNRAIVWHEDNFGSTFDVVDIPEDMKEEAKQYRALLIEEVASYDENLLEKFMEDENSITEDEVHAALESSSNGYVDHSYGMWFCIQK